MAAMSKRQKTTFASPSIGYHWIAMLDILGFSRMVETKPLMYLALDVARLLTIKPVTSMIGKSQRETEIPLDSAE
jgi:hypothetical protein